MDPTIVELVAATAAFVLSHYGLSAGPVRRALAGVLSETGFLGLYSVVALATLVWASSAYARAPLVALWPPLPALGWVTALLLLPAVLFLVAGLSAPNPTAVGQTAGLGPDAARGVLRLTRNPVMWAIGLWAVGHLLPNGDLASLVFFLGIVLLAIPGSYVLDAKTAGRHGTAWQGFAADTSNLPFAAVLAGRQSLGRAAAEIGWLRFAVALAVYAALLVGHPWLFGVSAVPL